DGAFSLHAPAGEWHVCADEREIVSSDLVAIAPGQRETFVAITVTPHDEMPAISGVLVDDTGAPVSDAMVRAGPGGFTQTNSDGSFRVEKGVGSTGDAATLWFQSKTGTHEFLQTKEKYAWGTAELRIVMQRRLAGDLVVVDVATGAPIEDYGVRC